MNTSRYFFSAFSFALIVLFFLPQQTVFADATQNISGWAWSSNIGWISFNSTNCPGSGTSNPCTYNPNTDSYDTPSGSPDTSADYGVNQNSVTNALTGYAWSPNIGWILFGCPDVSHCLSGFPTGTGTVSANAQVSGTSTTGWARACAGTKTGDCTTMTSRTDGWDGWISLSGIAGDSTHYGVFITPASSGSGGNFSGYAWGGPVIGWINFNPYVDQHGVTTVGCNGATNCSVTTTKIAPLSGFTLGCNGGSSVTISPSESVSLSVNPSNFNGYGAITVASQPTGLPNGTTVTYSFDGSDYYSFSNLSANPYNAGSFDCYYNDGTYTCYTYSYEISPAEFSVQFSPALPTGQTYSGLVLTANDGDSNPDPSSTCTVKISTAPISNPQSPTGPSHFQEF